MKRSLLIVAAAVVVLAVFWWIQKRESATSAVAVNNTKRQIPVDEMVPSREECPKGGAGLLPVERIPLPNPELPGIDARLVPAHLHPLLGWQNSGGYVPRRRLIESLGQNLSADEIRSLVMFIHAKPDQVGLTESDFNAVGDVVLLKLEDQKQVPADYTDHLVVLFYDESRNPTWRDYCIQHLGTVYQRTPEEKRPVIRQLYLDTLEPGSDFAGTTLLSMKRSTGTDDLPKEFVAEKAMEVASSDAYGDAERLSALHVATEFNHPDAVTLARQIVRSKQTALFRSASLAVIGMMGNETDKPLLEKYVKSSDIRLRTAASAALQRLETK
jgi:hypothetical protein